MFSAEIRINGSLVAHIYGRNIEPTGCDDIYRYDYEFYEPESGGLKKGTVHHARSDGISKLIGRVMNVVNGNDQEGGASDPVVDDQTLININKVLQHVFNQDEVYDMISKVEGGELCPGLLDDEEIELLGRSGDEKLIEKLCMDPNNNHIYAYTYRAWEGLGLDDS